MPSKSSHKNPIKILQSSLYTIINNPTILFPFCISAFIQLLILEILYFAPRYPLNIFFGPIIGRVWGEQFLHYPFNFTLLPKLFQMIQIPIYIFIGSFFIAMAVAIIIRINDGKTVHIKQTIKEISSSYVHVVIIALIGYLLVLSFFKIYGILFNRALLIHSQNGIFYWLKKIIIDGTPYFNLLLSVIAATIFAYVIPIIIIEKKKIFTAIWINFKTLWNSFWSTFCIVLLPSLLFVPVILFRISISKGKGMGSPELGLIILILSIIVMVLIDSIVYTGITIFYLLRKEDK